MLLSARSLKKVMCFDLDIGGSLKTTVAFTILATVMAISAAAVWPMVGDYSAHLAMWAHVLNGDDPWIIGSGNNYGPLFNLLAVPTLIARRLPKVLLAIAWAVTLSCFLMRDRRLVLSIVPLGIMQSVSRYGGEFDILVALCILGAIRSRRKEQDTLCGMWIGVGFLLKFLPIVMLPFLALDGFRVRWKTARSAIAVSGGGFALSAIIWGLRPTLRPLIHAGTRTSSWFSGFAFSRVAVGIDLDFLSGPLIALSLVALTIWFIVCKTDPVPTALAAIGLVIAFYRHGGTQYPVLLAVPAMWLAITSRNPKLTLATGLYCGWASAVWMFFPTVWETWSEGPYRELLKVSGGLPTFVLTLLLVAALIRCAKTPDLAGRRESTTSESTTRTCTTRTCNA
jgi:hypothetical protein